MAKLKTLRARAGLFIVSDSDLDFNQPVVRIKIDRSKGQRSRHHMQNIGGTLATLLSAAITSTVSTSKDALSGHPAGAARMRLSAGNRSWLLSADLDRPAGLPLSTVGVDRDRDRPNALTQYNQLNSATFSAVRCRA